MAIASQVAQVVRRAAGGRRVALVRLEVGALRQVIPETLAYAWGFVIKGTDLEGAELSTTWVPARLRCPRWEEGSGHDEVELAQDATTWVLGRECPRCGSRLAVLAGEECRVVDIEVAPAEA